MTDRYPVLQSGYVNLSEDGLVPFNPEHDPYIDVVLGQSYLTANNPYFYNKLITKLHRKWLSSPEVIKDFDFREQLLKLARTIFGTSDIRSWFMRQNGQRFVSDMHTRFLTETLLYVAGGNRTVAVNRWYTMLEANRDTVPSTYKPADYFKSPADNGSGLHCEGTVTKLDWTIDELIINWTKRTDGFVDMLIALNTIFGVRDCINDMASKRAS